MFLFRAFGYSLIIFCMGYTAFDINERYIKPVTQKVQEVSEISQKLDNVKFWEKK
jgi:hypothetical protein